MPIKQAISLIGTDEDAIIQLLSQRSLQQRQQIEKTYKASYGQVCFGNNQRACVPPLSTCNIKTTPKRGLIILFRIFGSSCLRNWVDTSNWPFSTRSKIRLTSMRELFIGQWRVRVLMKPSWLMCYALVQMTRFANSKKRIMMVGSVSFCTDMYHDSQSVTNYTFKLWLISFNGMFQSWFLLVLTEERQNRKLALFKLAHVLCFLSYW